VPPPLPQHTRRPAHRGRGRQDGRWTSTLGPDLAGLRRHRGRWLTWPLGCWRPQGDHRRDQDGRDQQVGGQEQGPKAAVPRWLGQLHHLAPCRAPSVQPPTDLPTSTSLTGTRSTPPVWPDREHAAR
jgi:hypothetical protein